MAIFEPKPWVNPFAKISNFLTFSTSCLHSLDRRFFVLEYRKRHFPALYCLKKKVGIFGPKPWVNPFGKMSIYRHFELLVFIAQKGSFPFKNIIKEKKKFGKMAIFGPKPCVNPFAKMSIFRLFKLPVFIALNGVFSLYNIVKELFLAYILQKKSSNNGHFWTKTMS